MADSKYALVVCARWETRYIREWLLYHRSIGFDHVYLYCNDDDPGELSEEVRPFSSGASPYVTFRHWPNQGQQRAMYLHFLQNDRHSAEWIMFLDIDEFLCLRGLNNIDTFMNSLPAAWDAVYFNWVYFGTSGFAERPDGSVLLQYTKREPVINPYTKVLIRSSKISGFNFQTAFWHDWTDVLGPTLQGFNVIGHSMHGYYSNFPDDAWKYLYSDNVMKKIFETAQVFHFAMKSEKDHVWRIERGLLGDFHHERVWNDLHHAGQLQSILEVMNSIEDTYLRDYWSRFLATTLGDCSIDS